VIVVCDQVLSFQNGQFDQDFSDMSVDTVRSKDSSQSDHPDVERSGIAATILGTIVLD